jgi:penicillin-insensitive murein endopeptidase
VILHPERHRQFGHPDLIQFLRELAASAAREKLAPIYIGDLGQARGGPTPTGHRSHQNGLDVDLFYGPSAKLGASSGKAKRTVDLASVVDLRTHKMLPAWNRGAARLLELAATQPSVDRVFVNPAVKRALCRGDARGSWLAKLRPWWGHADHFHVRLRCPATSPECTQQAPPAGGDGCDASLAHWFAAEGHGATEERRPPEALPAMPETCAALLER